MALRISSAVCSRYILYFAGTCEKLVTNNSWNVKNYIYIKIKAEREMKRVYRLTYSMDG